VYERCRRIISPEKIFLLEVVMLVQLLYLAGQLNILSLVH